MQFVMFYETVHMYAGAAPSYQLVVEILHFKRVNAIAT